MGRDAMREDLKGNPLRIPAIVSAAIAAS